MVKLFPFLLLTALFFTYIRPALSSSGLVINEFYALGDTSNPDWIELYNNSDQTVNLEGYVIRDSTESNKIDLDGAICAKSFRKFDFSNRLNKDGDRIRLLDSDSSSTPIDEIEYFSDAIPTHEENQSTSRQSGGSSVWQKMTSPDPQNDESCNIHESSNNQQSQASPTPSPTPSSSESTLKSSPKPKTQQTPQTTTQNTKQTAPVLGQKTTASPTIEPVTLSVNSQGSPSPSPSPAETKSISKTAGIIIGVGAIVLAASLLVFLWYKWEIKSTKTEEL